MQVDCSRDWRQRLGGPPADRSEVEGWHNQLVRDRNLDQDGTSFKSSNSGKREYNKHGHHCLTLLYYDTLLWTSKWLLLFRPRKKSLIDIDIVCPLVLLLLLQVQQKHSHLTGDNSVGARIFASSLSTATKPQTEDTESKPQSATYSTDHRTNEPRLTNHSKLHTTHRVRT